MDIPQIGFVLAILSALTLSAGRNYRWNLAALAGIYLGVFTLLPEDWSPAQSAIMLVGGWMAVAILGAAHTAPAAPDEETAAADAGLVFRGLVFGLVLLMAWSVSDGTIDWIPGISYQAAVVGILLAGAGLVRSGLVPDPLQVVVSVLMAYAGFEILYAALERSVLVTALLAAANLCLALVGAYLAAGENPPAGTEERP